MLFSIAPIQSALAQGDNSETLKACEEAANYLAINALNVADQSYSKILSTNHEANCALEGRKEVFERKCLFAKNRFLGLVIWK